MFLGWFANAVGWLRLGDGLPGVPVSGGAESLLLPHHGYYPGGAGAGHPPGFALVLAATIPFLIRNDGEAAQTVLAVAAALVVLLAANASGNVLDEAVGGKETTALAG